MKMRGSRSVGSKTEVLQRCAEDPDNMMLASVAISALDDDIRSRAGGLYRKFNSRMRSIDYDDLITIGQFALIQSVRSYRFMCPHCNCRSLSRCGFDSHILRAHSSERRRQPVAPIFAFVTGRIWAEIRKAIKKDILVSGYRWEKYRSVGIDDYKHEVDLHTPSVSRPDERIEILEAMTMIHERHGEAGVEIAVEKGLNGLTNKQLMIFAPRVTRRDKRDFVREVMSTVNEIRMQ